MSPTPRRKITGARPTAIGSKATTPSHDARDRARTSSGGISHSRSVRPQTPADRWAAAVDGVLERLKTTLSGRTVAHCQAERATGEGHTHGCVDLEDHSAGAHLCECGQMWTRR